jgi:hypothetical protein
MKKVLLVSLVMLLCVSVAFSQFGIKGGINLGTVGGADKSQGGVDPKTKLGLAGGISYKIGLVLGLSIQPEVMYIQKGAIYEVSQSQGNMSMSQKATLKGDYIDIPVLIKFNLPIPVFSPYIEGGVSYGILLSAKRKMEVTYTNVPGATSSSDETDVKESFIKNDLSLIVGVGFELLILDINARYVIGQKRLGKDDPATTTIDENAPKVYNRGIILTAGFRF